MGAPTSQAASTWCGAGTGTHQKQVEQLLGLKVDGVQSPDDCRTIRKFQVEHDVYPQYGYAGPVTTARATFVKAQNDAKSNPNKDGKCPTNVGRVACVDLTRQISWIQDGTKVVSAPVPVRTGRDGDETRTGLHKVYWRNKDHVSTLYGSAMPYSQFFDGGIAFHATEAGMWSGPGSHGCVNMTMNDAQRYWRMLNVGDEVFVYGKKPGT
ncbi:L,D-transpeptidase [Yinghuangia sp. ASG 101]|uniref:L,D-transpeptidase n=1 Tax=Yinghuangia sp. ASG 101 TaxID=2896848 RepID=UPI001E361ECB|nr:L,D-transpeptidase [Yinghuangia sp. ASG 101]UGQ15310.1 L,D-transpeptidase [Yinghuangia sp. ASG 101]